MLLILKLIVILELQVGFEMEEYTFNERAGQVAIYIIKENSVTISENFIVEVAMLQSSTATEGVYIMYHFTGNMKT